MVHRVLVIGGGSAGVSCAASLMNRNKDKTIDITIIEPSRYHYYQPGWTLAAAGVYSHKKTERFMKDVIPEGVKWISNAVIEFVPELNRVKIDTGEFVEYDILIVATGVQLDWGAIAGLSSSLGMNGVTSNYRYDLCSYTWELTQELSGGRALFTQPQMPIKCAGAPQKAMYMTCSHWKRKGVLENIDVAYALPQQTIFGVPDYVEPLNKYIQKYNIDVSYSKELVGVNGSHRVAQFEIVKDGKITEVEEKFDMLHAVPPQRPCDFVKNSSLADEDGWLYVNKKSLQHNSYENIFGVGDIISSPSAKTAAAARKQAPIVADNVISVLNGEPIKYKYDGYGSCPLTVEHGKVILAEFGYDNRLLPTFFKDSTVPSSSYWYLKAKLLPYLHE